MADNRDEGVDKEIFLMDQDLPIRVGKNCYCIFAEYEVYGLILTFHVGEGRQWKQIIPWHRVHSVDNKLDKK